MHESHLANHKEKKHIKSPWKLSSYLLANPHSRLLLKSWKSTCINFGLPSRRSEIQMLTTSKWKRRSFELIRKSFVKFFRYVLEFPTKTLLHHLQKKNWLHSFRNLAILASVTCYLQFILIKCTSLGEHLLQSSIADNREISSARKEHMPYARFTKVIIDHFISKDKTISMRNIINLYTVRDDPLFGTLKFVSKTVDTQNLIPRKQGKFKKVASPLRKLSPVLEAEPVKKAKRAKRPAKKSTTTPTASVIIGDTPDVSVSKKKAPARGDRGKGIELLSDAAVLEAAQVPDESEDKTTGTDEGTGTKPGVLDVPKYQSKRDDESWDDSEDDNDDDSKGDDDKADGDDDKDDGNDAHDSERTNLDDVDENPSFTLKDYHEEEHDEEYESDDDYENVYEEEDADLYKDVDLRLLGTEHDKERKGDEEVTDADQNVSQEKSYEQVVEDAHVTLTSSQKTESSKQSSSVSSDFASKFIILENVPPVVDEVFYDECQDSSGRSSTQAPSLFTVLETVILETATAHTTTSYTKEFEKKAQEKRKLYIDVIEKSVKEIIKDEVKSQLTQILPKEIYDFATPVIQRTITKSLENVVLSKSSSQPKSTYETATSLTEFELKKILLDKLEKSKSYRAAEVHRNLYDALVKSYQLDKDLFDSYGKAYSLKRSREDKDKDEDPRAGPDQGLKKRKTKKVVEPPRSSKSKDSQSSSSKGTKSQSKSSGKSDQPNVEAASKHDWFKKPERPPTPDPDWNAGKQIDFRPP
ncbi:hypothetical protein Tco_1263857 [Tanacetum coccineum]